ncbi:MAG: hypothetical protein JWR16_2454 [Nevskia sp.]|nr:hypothetical protein [Nevskia sp.]
MHIRICLLALLALLALMPVQADELSDLRAENARLRAQLEAAQKNAQPAPAPTANPVVPNPVAAPPIAPMATTTPPVAPTTVAAPAPAPAAAAPAAAAAAPVAETPAAPPGYKLVRVEPLPPSERYMDSGCSRGAFLGPPPAPWLDVDAWNGLRRGMAPKDVEDLIGVEHHDVDARGMKQGSTAVAAIRSAAGCCSKPATCVRGRRRIADPRFERDARG